VETTLTWHFDDPRGENVPEEEMLDTFREVRDEIQQKILTRLERRRRSWRSSRRSASARGGSA
jgi:hypothetical protein